MSKAYVGMPLPQASVHDWQAPTRVPDVAGAVLGVRMFRANMYAHYRSMLSLTRSTSWPTSAAICAVRNGRWGVKAHERHGDPVPSPRCTCGYWAVWNTRRLYDAMSGIVLPWTPHGGGFALVALVEAWGIVVEGRFGFRSEFMKVIAMVSPPDFRGHGPRIERATRQIAKEWNIPVVTPSEADARIERRRSGTDNSRVRP